MLKRKIKGLFKTLCNEVLNSEYIAYICNEDIKKVERILIQLEKEGFVK